MPGLISSLALPSFFELGDEVAISNRKLLHASGVLAVSLIGDSGCGKTSLLRATAERLRPGLCSAAIVAEPAPSADVPQVGCKFVRVSAGGSGRIEPGHLHDALTGIDLHETDVLFIESIGSLVRSGDVDLGQDLRVAVFSVAGGDDKAAKHAALVAKANALVLTKTDQLGSSAFDADRFRNDVHRLNPAVRLFEVSVRDGQGLEEWAEWLRQKVPNQRERVSAWFG